MAMSFGKECKFVVLDPNDMFVFDFRNMKSHIFDILIMIPSFNCLRFHQ